MEAGYGAEEQARRRARRAGERKRDLAANERASSTVEAKLERLQFSEGSVLTLRW